MTFLENLHKSEVSAGLTFNQSKYRCEQVVTTKINEIPVSSVQLKTDYFIEKIMDSHNNIAFHFRIDDNISTMFPAQYSKAMDMVNELEAIKSNVILSVNPTSGEIGRVLDFDDVKSHWNSFKEELVNRYKFLRASDAREGLAKIVSSMEELLASPDLYLKELQSKIFFMTFFGKYLVGKENWESPHEINFRSQLFNGINTKIPITQEIGSESQKSVVMSRRGEIPKSIRNNREIEKLYDKNYKPSIQYKFTEYQVEYEAEMEINTEENYLNKAHIYLSEEVVNNIFFSTSCNIRKIED